MEDRTRKSGDLWSGVASRRSPSTFIVQAPAVGSISAWRGPGPASSRSGTASRCSGFPALLIRSHNLSEVPPGGTRSTGSKLSRAFSTLVRPSPMVVVLFKPLGFVVGFRAADLLHRRGGCTASRSQPPALVALRAPGGFYLVFDRRAQREPPGRYPGFLSRGNRHRSLERVRGCAGARRIYCGVSSACFSGTVVGILPGLGHRQRSHAPAAHLQHEPCGRYHHARRYLLRRQVRRIDHFDP